MVVLPGMSCEVPGSTGNHHLCQGWFGRTLTYKPPAGDESRLIKVGLIDGGLDAVSQASGDLRFAAAVAGFGMLLRDSPHKESLTYDAVLELASSAARRDPQGYRREFLTLVRKAQMLSR
jgi:Ca-activated chloride channel family protein